MTAPQIIAKLFTPVTKARIEKAKGAAARSKVDWQAVLDAMTPEQRKAVDNAAQ